MPSIFIVQEDVQTFTLKIVSTAFLTSTLFALRSTSKIYWFPSSSPLVLFSVIDKPLDDNVKVHHDNNAPSIFFTEGSIRTSASYFRMSYTLMPSVFIIFTSFRFRDDFSRIGFSLSRTKRAQPESVRTVLKTLRLDLLQRKIAEDQQPVFPDLHAQRRAEGSHALRIPSSAA